MARIRSVVLGIPAWAVLCVLSSCTHRFQYTTTVLAVDTVSLSESPVTPDLHHQTDSVVFAASWQQFEAYLQARAANIRTDSTISWEDRDRRFRDLDRLRNGVEQQYRADGHVEIGSNLVIDLVRAGVGTVTDPRTGEPAGVVVARNLVHRCASALCGYGGWELQFLDGTVFLWLTDVLF